MLKTLGAQIKEFKKDSIRTPLFMILEVLMEMMIPFLMASIIDDGVEKGDIRHICIIGAVMIVAAFIGLYAGIMGGICGANASAGLAKNLRKAIYENIQRFSFSNIDKFSTAGLITRLTTDVTNVQNAYQMLLRMFVRAPISMICAMIMSFYINAKLASIYLIAVIILGAGLFFIIYLVSGYFREVFKKYDKLILTLTDLLVDDDDTGDSLREALNRIEKFRLEIKIKYRKYLKKKELEKMSKQLIKLKKEAMIRLMGYLDYINSNNRTL